MSHPKVRALEEFADASARFRVVLDEAHRQVWAMSDEDLTEIERALSNASGVITEKLRDRSVVIGNTQQ